MQICNATVRLQGDVRFQVPKEGITPAELLVLRHVQGAEDAVADIVMAGEVTRNMHEEMARLSAYYGDKKVKELFPGVSPRIPVTFDEIAVVPKPATAPLIVAEPKPERPRRGRPLSAPTGALPAGTPHRPVSAETAEAADKRDPADDAELEDGPETPEMPGV